MLHHRLDIRSHLSQGTSIYLSVIFIFPSYFILQRLNIKSLNQISEKSKLLILHLSKSMALFARAEETLTNRSYIFGAAALYQRVKVWQRGKIGVRR